ncbi:MAG: HAMP domain-containing sensor histidine kinase [Candidatus Nanopelagicales bacterium]
MPTDAPRTPADPVIASLRSRAHGLSLNARIALVTVASAVVAVLVAGAISYPLIRQAAQQESLGSLQRLADATAVALERQPGPGPDQIPNRLANTLRSEDITALYVPRGASIPGLFSAGDFVRLQAGAVLDGEVSYAGDQVLVAVRALTDGNAVVLTQPVQATGRLALAALARFAFALLVGAALAVAFGLLLARRLTRPLRDAAQAAKRLGAGDRDVELAVTGPPEIAELNEALNELRRDLAISEGRQREFLLSISHELRTPLTAIRGYAEAITDGVVPVSEISAKGAIVQSEANRLDLLVADLLDLARLDAVDFSVSIVAVDYASIATAAAAVWRDRSERENMQLRLELGAPSIQGRSDPTRVRQIIDNLCANALRVTPSPGVLVLHVSAPQPGWVKIEVRDSGPGLTPDDCRVAFEPAELYSRYQGIRRVGTGVGLALVGRLSTRLGGTAHAGSAPEGGACFTIYLAANLGS